jgi:Helix-turn-helix domain
MPLMTNSETARYLKSSTAYLNHARGRGDGPPFTRVGRHIRYDQRRVDEWLAANERTSTSQEAPPASGLIGHNGGPAAKAAKPKPPPRQPRSAAPKPRPPRIDTFNDKSRHPAGDQGRGLDHETRPAAAPLPEVFRTVAERQKNRFAGPKKKRFGIAKDPTQSRRTATPKPRSADTEARDQR